MPSHSHRKAKVASGVAVAAALVLAVGPVAGHAQSEPTHPTVPTPAGATLTVSPTSVAAGGTVTVKGTKCATNGAPGGPNFVIGNAPDGPFIDDPMPVANSAGNWNVSASIPASLAPGTYEVRAFCLNAPGSDTGFVYAPVTLTVTATTTAAKGVKARPNFTG